MKENFYILSIDGGGLKGLIAIRILQIIEGIIRQSVAAKFDFLAGTSTGGLIVAALAAGNAQGEPSYDLAHIESLYMEVGQSVFRQGGLSLTGKESTRFDLMLKQTFGKMRLSETLKPVFIPTYDLSHGKLIGFKTRSARKDPSKDALLLDVCRATSAIPPVFPTYVFTYNNRQVHCLDAGYQLKNPALSALAEVVKHKSWYGVKAEDNIVLLSVSTGSHYAADKDWSTDISDILHAQKTDMDYIAAQSLDIDFRKVRFLRVDLKLGGSPFSITQLIEWAERIDALSKNKAFAADIRTLLV